MDFEGKTLMVTGAGSGMGASLARRYSSLGGKVAVLDLDEAAAAAVAVDLPGSVPIQCDVSDEGSVDAAIARIADEFDGLDHVVAAAGIMDAGPIEEWNVERWNRLIGVHLTGTWLIAKAGVPLLRQRGNGAIVNFSSVAGISTQPFNVSYGAAKAGIIGLTRQLAVEVAPEIRVNTIAPGRILTPMSERLYVERGDGDMQRGIDLALPRVPMGFLAKPEEIAATVCFLLSDEARFITGQTIVQDGGETLL